MCRQNCKSGRSPKSRCSKVLNLKTSKPSRPSNASKAVNGLKSWIGGAGVSPKLQVRKESEIPMPESPQSQNLKTLKALIKCLESRQQPEIVDRRGRGVAKIASPEGVRNPDARKSKTSKPSRPSNASKAVNGLKSWIGGAGVSPKLQVRKESEIPMPESPQSQNLKTIKALKCLESRQRPEIADRRGRGVAQIASPEGVRNPDAGKSSISKPQNPQGPQMPRKPSTA